MAVDMIRTLRFCRKAVLLRALIVSVCLSVSCASVNAADNLSDPTRPPASTAGFEHGQVATETTGPVLQSVLISSGRRVAVISGQNVKLGEKFGDARVVRITESEVVLKNGKDTQTLKLFPDVEKRRVSIKTRAKGNSQRPKTEGKE